VNYYRRHIGDYLRDTAHLSLLEHGVYTRLLDIYYTHECPIPVSQAERLVGARSRDEKEATARVLVEFFQVVDECWVQDRCNREIEVAQAKAERNREVGKRGGRTPGAGMKSEPRGNPDGFHEEPKHNPSHKPIANSHKPKEERERAPAAPTRPDDVPEQVWQDFLTHRKSKRAPVTDTVLAGFRTEARKAGISLADAMSTSCRRGWQGFEADWHKGSTTRRETANEVNARIIAGLTGRLTDDEEPQDVPVREIWPALGR